MASQFIGSPALSTPSNCSSCADLPDILHILVLLSVCVLFFICWRLYFTSSEGAFFQVQGKSSGSSIAGLVFACTYTGVFI